jgi:hypothetical protein
LYPSTGDSHKLRYYWRKISASLCRVTVRGAGKLGKATEEQGAICAVAPASFRCVSSQATSFVFATVNEARGCLAARIIYQCF